MHGLFVIVGDPARLIRKRPGREHATVMAQKLKPGKVEVDRGLRTLFKLPERAVSPLLSPWPIPLA